MQTFKITVQSNDGSNLFETPMEFPIEQLRATPNPRQALCSHFLYMTQEVLAEVDPKLSL